MKQLIIILLLTISIHVFGQIDNSSKVGKTRNSIQNELLKVGFKKVDTLSAAKYDTYYNKFFATYFFDNKDICTHYSMITDESIMISRMLYYLYSNPNNIVLQNAEFLVTEPKTNKQFIMKITYNLKKEMFVITVEEKKIKINYNELPHTFQK